MDASGDLSDTLIEGKHLGEGHRLYPVTDCTAKKLGVGHDAMKPAFHADTARRVTAATLKHPDYQPDNYKTNGATPFVYLDEAGCHAGLYVAAHHCKEATLFVGNDRTSTIVISRVSKLVTITKTTITAGGTVTSTETVKVNAS